MLGRGENPPNSHPDIGDMALIASPNLCHSSGGGGGGKSKYVGGADACRAGKAAAGRVVVGRAVAGRMVVGRVVVGTLAVLEAITPDIGGRAWTASPLCNSSRTGKFSFVGGDDACGASEVEIIGLVTAAN